MKSVDRSKYKIFLLKGEQHQKAGDIAHREKSYDAAVTNYSVALINFLDALSVNRFGTDLSSDSHESAPLKKPRTMSSQSWISHSNLR